MTESLPTVVLVDDHAIFRAGVRAELDGLVTILGEAGDVESAVREIIERAPDVVLLDVHLPGGGGVEILRRLSTEAPDAKCLALSVSDDPEDVIAVIRAGARGYVTKTISPTELVDAIRRVQEGDAVFSPRLAGFVLDAFANDGSGGGSALRRPARPTPSSTSSPRASARSCATSPAATSTRRSPSASGSPSRPSRPTSAPCCASSSSPPATSSAAGPSSDVSWTENV